jgi:hypothetical protein
LPPLAANLATALRSPDGVTYRRVSVTVRHIGAGTRGLSGYGAACETLENFPVAHTCCCT